MEPNISSIVGDSRKHVGTFCMHRKLPGRNIMRATEYALKAHRLSPRSIRYRHFAALRRALHSRHCVCAINAAIMIRQLQFKWSKITGAVLWRNRSNTMREQPALDAATD